jgi:FG-GAP-like repeat
MRSFALRIAIGLPALALSACTAETRPASNVGSTSATLNARGHTDGTPAHYEFQYATSEAALGTAAGAQTPTRGPIPPHVSAPFSEPVGGLTFGTTYFFRVCGGDQSIHPDVCDSIRSFTTTAPGARVAFAPAVTYPVHSTPAGVATAGLQAPGSRDIVTANPATNDVSVLLNHGDGVFAPAVNYPAGQGPHAIAVGNFTGAGRRDVVTANGTGNVSVLLGNGHGGLGAPVSYALSAAPQTLAIGDFNGDGHEDIATFEDLPPTPNPNDPYGNTSAGVVSVLLGNGGGTFGAAVNTTVIPAEPCGVHGVCPTPTDMSLSAGALHTGTSRSDLVLVGTSAAHDFFLNVNSDSPINLALSANGDGTFTTSSLPLPPPQQTLGPPQSGLAAVALGDLNGDAKLDEGYLNAAEVFTENSSGMISGYVANAVESSTGNGDGTFNSTAAAASLPSSETPLPVTGSLRIAAITSPVRRDLVSTVPGVGTLYVTPNNGNGTFGTPVPVTPQTVYSSVAAADVNRDGKADLVAGESQAATVDVLDNATAGG